MHDYGSAWRILRLSSLTDQIYIKAQRIRGIQINKTSKIDEGQEVEFVGLINYSIMCLDKSKYTKLVIVLLWRLVMLFKK